MKQELQRARVSSYCEWERSSRPAGDTQPQADELQTLREENERLKSMVELGTFSVVKDYFQEYFHTGFACAVDSFHSPFPSLGESSEL